MSEQERERDKNRHQNKYYAMWRSPKFIISTSSFSFLSHSHYEIYRRQSSQNVNWEVTERLHNATDLINNTRSTHKRAGIGFNSLLLYAVFFGEKIEAEVEWPRKDKFTNRIAKLYTYTAKKNIMKNKKLHSPLTSNRNNKKNYKRLTFLFKWRNFMKKKLKFKFY